MHAHCTLHSGGRMRLACCNTESYRPTWESGPVMFAMNGSWKRNSFSTSLLVTVAAEAAVAAAAADHHHHHHQYGHISKRRYPPPAAVVVAFPLVEPAEFFDLLGNAPETCHRRFANVLIVNGPQ